MSFLGCSFGSQHNLIANENLEVYTNFEKDIKSIIKFYVKKKGYIKVSDSGKPGSRLYCPGIIDVFGDKNIAYERIKRVALEANRQLKPDLPFSEFCDLYGRNVKIYLGLIDIHKQYARSPEFARLKEDVINRFEHKLVSIASRVSALRIDENNTEEEQVFIDPISFAPFKDPVQAPDGRIYERSIIEPWLKTHHRSPYTNQRMSVRELITNYHIRSHMEQLGLL